MRKTLKSLSSSIISVSEDCYFLEVTSSKTSVMIATSIFIKVICNKKVAKMNITERIALVVASLFTNSKDHWNSPRASR